MKALAINGSPRMRASSTWHMLKPLLAGMEAAGATTEVIHVRKLDLKPCIGCFTCWVRTPGECIHDDAMGDTIKRVEEADLLIYGTPLYHFTMSGIMKTFIDRTLPLVEPWLIPHPTMPGMTGHPKRHQKSRQMLLVSPCGFPEFENFQALTATFRFMAQMKEMTYLGEILRPLGEGLSQPELQGVFDDYYALLRRAGREIVETSAIPEETQEALRQPLFPGDKRETYQMAEAYWTELMDRFKVPEEKRHIAPLLAQDLQAAPRLPLEGDRGAPAEPLYPERIPNRVIAETMADMYRPDVIPDLRATIQLHLIPPADGFDPGPPDWVIILAPDGASAAQGRTPFPTISIDTPQTVWREIGQGKLDPVQAFEDGLYEMYGHMRLLGQLADLFTFPEAEAIRVEAEPPPDAESPTPTDIKQMSMAMLLRGMAESFNPEAASDLETTIQFDVSGEEQGQYHFQIADGQCAFFEGAADGPDLTIQTPAEVWKQISAGEMDGSWAFMRRKYRVKGDFRLLLKFDKLFKQR